MRWGAIEARYQVFWQVLGQESSQLATHFTHIGFTPGLIVTDWWLTLFSRHFSPDIVGRLWDCFLLEGEPLLFRAAVGICKTLENRLINQPLEVCLDVINKSGDEFTQDSFFQTIAEVRSSVKSIRQLLDHVSE